MFFDIHTHSEFSSSTATSIYNAGLNENLISYHSVGIHPYDVHQFTFDHSKMLKLTQAEKCLAIGEIGLDKLISTPILQQQKIFEAQLTLSEQVQLPVLLHCVKTWNEIQHIKRTGTYTQQWIFHGFRKTSLLDSILSEGVGISIGAAILTDKKLQDVIQYIPSDRLYLESDNATVAIETIYQQLATVLCISIEMVIKQQTLNFKSTFKKFKKLE